MRGENGVKHETCIKHHHNRTNMQKKLFSWLTILSNECKHPRQYHFRPLVLKPLVLWAGDCRFHLTKEARNSRVTTE